MDLKVKDINFYLNIAKLASENSSAIRLKVGGVMCDSNGDIIATGYNGTVRGMDNTCEDKVYWDGVLTPFGASHILDYYPFAEVIDGITRHYKLVTKSDVIHSEMNILAHAARRGISVRGGAIFLTHSPCAHCAGMLIQSGVKDVYFLNKFRTYDEVIAKYSDRINLIQWEMK